MNRRAFAAIVRLALIRGQTVLLASGSASLLGLLGTILFDGPVRVFAAIVAGFSLMIALPLPFKTLVADKMFGHMEFDRTLPVPLRTIAAARLAGATARSIPAVLSLSAMGALVAALSPYPTRMVLVALGLTVLLYWCVVWIGYALGARFPMRKLMWIPGVFWLVLMFSPDSVEEAMEARIELLADQLLGRSDPSTTLLLLIGAGALAVAALAFVVATLILSDALGRFRADPSVMQGPLGAVPKKELASLGRGPILAVARLRLRLATAEFRKQMIVIAVLIVVSLADFGEATDFARTYLRFVTMLLPAMIAMQLMRGRALGSLEAIQQLPHPRRMIGFGHLLAVMVMAVPAVGIDAISRAAAGVPLGIDAGIVRWFWYVAAGSIAVGLAAWGTAGRMLALLGIIIVSPIALLLLAGWIRVNFGATTGLQFADLVALWQELGAFTANGVPIATAMVLTLAGNELFAWGLATYKGQGVK